MNLVPNYFFINRSLRDNPRNSSTQFFKQTDRTTNKGDRGRQHKTRRNKAAEKGIEVAAFPDPSYVAPFSVIILQEA
jgi:hypothetical protein